jgi:hypothetical protein
MLEDSVLYILRHKQLIPKGINGLGKAKTAILSLLIIYLVYTWILFKPPRKGWDLFLVKITVWITVTLLALVIIAGYWALVKD